MGSKREFLSPTKLKRKSGTIKSISGNQSNFTKAVPIIQILS
jgi:hypothetical protein